MKSIADNNRKHAYLARRDEVEDDEALLVLASRQDYQPSVEEVMLATEEMAQGPALLRHDETAMTLLELLQEGCDKGEILAAMGLSDTAYNSLRRRVRRKIGSLPGSMVGRRR